MNDDDWSNLDEVKEVKQLRSIKMVLYVTSKK